MNKKVIMMLYPTRAEANIGHDKVYLTLKDPIVAHRSSDLIETAEVRIHFMSICANYYGWLEGYKYDNVYIDSRINVDAYVKNNMTLEQFIQSRKRQ